MADEPTDLIQAIAALRVRVDEHDRHLGDVDRRLALIVTEMRASIDRISNEGREQRLALVESTVRLAETVTGFQQTLDLMVSANERILSEHKRGLDAFMIAHDSYNRNAEATAVRLRMLETSFGTLQCQVSAS